MIILNSKKINTNFKKNLQNYINIVNFPLLTCPVCGSTHFIKWGTYDRNVIFFDDNKCSLESLLLTVQRIKCKSCNKTHALLPFGIIPYKQFTDEVISEILLELIHSNVDEISTKYRIDSSIIKTWIKQFKKYHLSKVSTLTSCHNNQDTLTKFFSNYSYKLKYIIVNHKCFMQIKLGILSLCPS